MFTGFTRLFNLFRGVEYSHVLADPGTREIWYATGYTAHDADEVIDALKWLQAPEEELEVL